MSRTIEWSGEHIAVRTLTTSCDRFRIGDLVMFRGELSKVVTVQPGCVSTNKYGKPFCEVILESREGALIPHRDMGSRQVFRPVR